MRILLVPTSRSGNTRDVARAICARCEEPGHAATWIDADIQNLPIRQGQLVETIARVVEVGRTSMQVEVELIAEDLLSGERELCTRGRFVMIALDARGRPAQVAQLPKAHAGDDAPWPT